MGVVNKRADELKPGDMLVISGHAGVVKSINSDKATTAVFVQGIDSATFMPNGAQMQVIAPDLTLVQQHADALLALVESMPVTDKITALLDKIHPPVPPTMDEVMTTLVGLTDPKVTAAESSARIKALVDKARRAGMVK